MLEKIFKEQKYTFLLGDFNVNILNYNDHDQSNDFLDYLSFNLFIPTRITSHSNTLIDMFSNVIDLDMILDNLIVTVSDHLPQFATCLAISQAINIIFMKRNGQNLTGLSGLFICWLG